MQLTVTTFLSVDGGLLLDESCTTGSGATISTYRAAGRPEFGEVEVS